MPLRARWATGRSASPELHVPAACAGRDLERLDLRGVTGGRLLLNAHGVAMDVAGSRFHRPRTGYLRDVSFA